MGLSSGRPHSLPSKDQTLLRGSRRSASNAESRGTANHSRHRAASTAAHEQLPQRSAQKNHPNLRMCEMSPGWGAGHAPSMGLMVTVVATAAVIAHAPSRNTGGPTSAGHSSLSLVYTGKVTAVAMLDRAMFGMQPRQSDRTPSLETSCTRGGETPLRNTQAGYGTECGGLEGNRPA